MAWIVLNGGAGSDTHTGGAGDDVFIIAPRFRLGHDHGLWHRHGPASVYRRPGSPIWRLIQASSHETDGDLTIRLSFTETLTLENTSLDALTAETVTTLGASGVDTTAFTAPTYFFFDADGTPTGAQNSGTPGGDILVTGDGNDLLLGRGGNDTLIGSAGNDTLTGGEGDDVFIIGPGAGSDTITDFGTGTDRLQFEGGLFANLEAVQAAASETDGDLTIRLSDTETLTVENTSPDALTAETVTTLDADGADTTTTDPERRNDRSNSRDDGRNSDGGRNRQTTRVRRAGRNRRTTVTKPTDGGEPTSHGRRRRTDEPTVVKPETTVQSSGGETDGRRNR